MYYYDIIVEILLKAGLVVSVAALDREIYFAIRKSKAESRKKLQDKIEKTEMSNVDNDLKKYFRY